MVLVSISQQVQNPAFQGSRDQVSAAAYCQGPPPLPGLAALLSDRLQPCRTQRGAQSGEGRQEQEVVLGYSNQCRCGNLEE